VSKWSYKTIEAHCIAEDVLKLKKGKFAIPPSGRRRYFQHSSPIWDKGISSFVLARAGDFQLICYQSEGV